MTDLRTRIARTVWISHRDRQLAQLGMKPSEYAADIPTPDWAYAIADAVIRELGLQSYKSNESQKPLNFDLRTSEEWGCGDDRCKACY